MAVYLLVESQVFLVFRDSKVIALAKFSNTATMAAFCCWFLEFYSVPLFLIVKYGDYRAFFCTSERKY